MQESGCDWLDRQAEWEQMNTENKNNNQKAQDPGNVGGGGRRSKACQNKEACRVFWTIVIQPITTRYVGERGRGGNVATIQGVSANIHEARFAARCCSVGGDRILQAIPVHLEEYVEAEEAEWVVRGASINQHITLSVTVSADRCVSLYPFLSWSEHFPWLFYLLRC